MSRNSKNAKRLVAARALSKERKNGGGGPAKTTPKHGKVNVTKYNRADRKGPTIGGKQERKEQSTATHVGE